MAKKSPTQTPPKSFEEALREVEQILGEIEGGSIGLEESLLKHERGAFLIAHCRGILDRAEKHIELLSHGPNETIRVEKETIKRDEPAEEDDAVMDEDADDSPAPF